VSARVQTVSRRIGFVFYTRRTAEKWLATMRRTPCIYARRGATVALVTTGVAVCTSASGDRYLATIVVSYTAAGACDRELSRVALWALRYDSHGLKRKDPLVPVIF